MLYFFGLNTEKKALQFECQNCLIKFLEFLNNWSTRKLNIIGIITIVLYTPKYITYTVITMILPF